MNIQERLLHEIERVTRIRSMYEELRGMRNVIVEPQIAMMTRAIEAGKKAASSDDALTVMSALKELEAWTE